MGVPMPQFDPGLLTERLQRRGGQMPDRIISNEKARSLMGWTPTYADFRQGYAQLLCD